MLSFCGRSTHLQNTPVEIDRGVFDSFFDLRGLLSLINQPRVFLEELTSTSSWIIDTMYIKSIAISNFRSFRQQPEIQPFSSGTNSVVGRNGSGKSNLFDAVQFVLLAPRFANLRQVSKMKDCVLVCCEFPVQFCPTRTDAQLSSILTLHLCKQSIIGGTTSIATRRLWIRSHQCLCRDCL